MSFSDQTFFLYCLYAHFLIGPLTFISLKFLQVPYGKYHRPGWGPAMPAPLAWFLMESPTLWLTLLIFPFGLNSANPKALILMSPFLIHYFNRVCLYPLRLLKNFNRNTVTGVPLSVAAMGFGYNIFNTYLQARWVSQYKDYQTDLWFWWRFLVGMLVFLYGMAVNIESDRVLVGLKIQGQGYKIPRGGWFELVSCPNYFGEILEWLGWAVMTWPWVGLSFFLYTCSNLVPRARANHQWYLEKFEDYPKGRKAVIPFLY